MLLRVIEHFFGFQRANYVDEIWYFMNIIHEHQINDKLLSDFMIIFYAQKGGKRVIDHGNVEKFFTVMENFEKFFVVCKINVKSRPEFSWKFISTQR